MERKEVIATRATIARMVSTLMAKPQFYRDLVEMGSLDDDGDIPMVIAGEDESAIITMHRLEALHVEDVVLATSSGPTTVNMIGLRCQEVSEPSSDAIDLMSGMTVRDWLDMVKVHPGNSFTASGSDIFIPSANPNQYAVAGMEAGFAY